MFASLLHRDWSIRLIGVAMLLAGAMALHPLFGGQVEPGSAADIVIAGCGFLGCTAGAALTCLGAHIHDRVPVARPWGGQPFGDGEQSGFAAVDDQARR